MAYPTGMLALVLEDIDRTVVWVKAFSAAFRTTAAAGNVTSSQILDLFVNLQQAKATLTALSSTTGLAQYARDQKNNQGLDVVAEFVTVQSALDGSVGWVTSNFPKDGNGYLLAKSFSGTTIIDRLFTPAQTAGLRTTLDTLIATIA